MDLFDRIYKAHEIFRNARHPVERLRRQLDLERSRWVADETWHPQQTGRFENKHYILEVPYSDSRELVMDILKHSPHVEVLAPATLKSEVVRHLEAGLRKQKAAKARK
ncbi:MAG: WYL domain-containing protein [Candidatus Firestonebacteria bacterium]|nr:WYL domain-containing protein [Candidatus Firestonebacteria bacterium]